MSNYVKVSIVIPTYEQPDFFNRLLESIYNQTEENFEIIVTDDSRSDSIRNICDSKSQDPRLHYFHNDVAKGSPDNWNAGILRARGEYIKIMHHDDWFTDKNSLKHFIALLDKNPSCDFGFSASLNVSLSFAKVHKLNAQFERMMRCNPNILYTGNHVGAPSATIYRRNDILFDKNLKWLVDLEFYIRCLRINKNFAFTTEPLISIGQHEQQITQSCINNNSIEINEHLYVFDKLALKHDRPARKKLANVLAISEATSYQMRKHNLSWLFIFYVKVHAFTYRLKRLRKLLKKTSPIQN